LSSATASFQGLAVVLGWTAAVASAGLMGAAALAQTQLTGGDDHDKKIT
jgi:hypothetical protein